MLEIVVDIFVQIASSNFQLVWINLSSTPSQNGFLDASAGSFWPMAIWAYLSITYEMILKLWNTLRAYLALAFPVGEAPTPPPQQPEQQQQQQQESSQPPNNSEDAQTGYTVSKQTRSYSKWLRLADEAKLSRLSQGCQWMIKISSPVLWSFIMRCTADPIRGVVFF